MKSGEPAESGDTRYDLSALWGHGTRFRGRRALRIRRGAADPDHRGQVDAAETLAKLLDLWGHEVRVVHDGAIMLDIGLPGMDGYEVAVGLQAAGALDGATFIALTGYAADRHSQRGTAAGFEHHLTKPVDPERLRILLMKLPVH